MLTIPLFMPLTQQLDSALIEENIMTPLDDVMTEITGILDLEDKFEDNQDDKILTELRQKKNGNGSLQKNTGGTSSEENFHREREQAWKALKERDTVIKQLETKLK